jgi:hypothetical protein
VNQCRCATRSASDQYNNSYIIFSGIVTNIVRQGSYNRVTFNVYRTFKGASYNKITVNTNASTGACGYNFERGSEYLVYTTRTGNNLIVDLCNRTSLLDNACYDLASISRRRP